MTEARWSLPARIRRNIGFKVLGTGVEKGLRLVLVFAAARLLGPEQWGRYTYAFALAMLLVQLTDMGLGLFLNREIARAGKTSAALIGEVLSFKAVLALGYIAAIGGLALVHFLDPDPREHTVAAAILLCGGIALATSAIEAIVQVFRGIQRLELEARAHSVHAVAAVVVGGAGLIVIAGLHSFEFAAWKGATDDEMLLYAAALLVASLSGLAYAWRLLGTVATVRFGLSRDLVVRFKNEVLPLGIAIVASMIYYRIDVPMIRHMLPEATADLQTGLYTAGYKLLEHTALVPAILMAAAFPALSETVVSDNARARALHATTLRWLLLAGGAVCLVFAFGSELIVTLLYGSEFAGSAPILVALAPCVLLTFVNYLETHMLVAMGLVKAQMLISVALIGVNVGLNWWWIPMWGGKGAAWATAVTEVGLFIAVAPLVYRGLKPGLEPGEGMAS